MSATLDPLVMDLVAFVASEPRPYEEVIDAWRTSCPRLTVWEDAIDRGLIARFRALDRTLIVQATSAGLQFLQDSGRLPPEQSVTGRAAAAHARHPKAPPSARSSESKPPRWLDRSRNANRPTSVAAK